MNEDFLRRLESDSGVPGLATILAERLSGADLNSLLLEVFRCKTEQLSAPDLLRQYRQNRFVQPATVDAVGFSEFCLHWMKAARDAGFQPLQLSPVSPLGSCSVFGAVHQNKVMSALRGAELVADATNVLALESALQRRDKRFPPEATHFSVVHRHVRAQEVPKVPGFSAHFSILGLSSAGRDTGSFTFEKENLRRHIAFYKIFFEEKLDLAPVKIRLKSLKADGSENRLVQAVVSFLQENEPNWPVEIVETRQSEQAYYRGLQFKIVIPNPGGNRTEFPELEIADGGFTDWTQRLSHNAKERLLISGMGLELLYKMLHP